VQYVGNIYKYYLAYELVKQREAQKAAAKAGTSKDSGATPPASAVP
jgi:hypothetical protein